MPFLSYSCAIAMARTSSTMLNKWDESRHPCLVPNHNGNACSFCLLSMMLAVHLSYMASIMFRYGSSMPILLRVFILNGCCILSNAFPMSIYMIMWFLSFILFMWWITFIDLWMLYQTCIPRINPTWSWCIFFLMHCCVQFANILLSILASMFIRDIGLYFSFFL